MKSKYWLYGILAIVIVGVIFISGCTQKSSYTPQETTQTEQQPNLGTGLLNINAEKNNQFSNGEYVNNYYTYTYDCKWSGLNIKCDGEIQYIGPSNVEVSGAHLDLWCVDKRGCILGTDQVDIRSMDRQIYTLSCSVGQKKDVEVNLAIKDAVSVYINPAHCD